MCGTICRHTPGRQRTKGGLNVSQQQLSALILHADDFGMNAAVTEGIIEAFGSGLLTSTSLLANAPAAEFALEQWRRLDVARQSGDLPSQTNRRRLGDLNLPFDACRNEFTKEDGLPSPSPKNRDGLEIPARRDSHYASRLRNPTAARPFDLGVHLNLTQGIPLTAGRFPSELLDTSNCFLGPGRLYRRLRSNGRRWYDAIRDELRAQVTWLFDRGVTPTHFNGHQYVEMMPVVSEIIAELAGEYRVRYVRAAIEPRHWRTSLQPGFRLANGCLSHVKQHYAHRWAAMLDRFGINHADAFFGSSHAGCITLAIMRRFARQARKHSLVEIAFHPGQSSREKTLRHDVDGWHDPLSAARANELALLCSSELAELLATSSFQLGRMSPSGKRLLTIAKQGRLKPAG